MSETLLSLPLSIRLDCFIRLGKELSALKPESKETLASRAKYENPWFTESNVLLALDNLIRMLEEEELINFVINYPLLKENKVAKTVALVLAGNIPAVGFHDVLCVLLSGHKIMAKLSKSDTVLMKFILDTIVELEPKFADFIQIEERIANFDAVICTGSDNSARYFEHYFGKYPNIIRKNRTSIAVLSGNETEMELRLLADDIFAYYGFGCRNVSKLFLQKNVDIIKVIDAFEPYSSIVNHHKYANNYDYNRAIFLVNLQHSYDNGFALIREDSALFSPLSVIHFEYYDTTEEVLQLLEKWKNSIQCIVSKLPEIRNRIDFGKTQSPHLLDYADGVDTMRFLLELNNAR